MSSSYNQFSKGLQKIHHHTKIELWLYIKHIDIGPNYSETQAIESAKLIIKKLLVT